MGVYKYVELKCVTRSFQWLVEKILRYNNNK